MPLPGGRVPGRLVHRNSRFRPRVFGVDVDVDVFWDGAAAIRIILIPDRKDHRQNEDHSGDDQANATPAALIGNDDLPISAIAHLVASFRWVPIFPRSVGRKVGRGALRTQGLL